MKNYFLSAGFSAGLSSAFGSALGSGLVSVFGFRLWRGLRLHVLPFRHGTGEGILFQGLVLGGIRQITN